MGINTQFVYTFEKEQISKRIHMVESQLRARGIRDAGVLAVMAKIPRHRFVPVRDRDRAYEDHPLSIACHQTISQPYIVACIAQLLELTGREKVLEIGAGCGYQAAVLAGLAGAVYSVEWFEELAAEAVKTLGELRLTNVHVRVGDGKKGWPENAPFDRVLVSCAVREVPSSWGEQLKPGGMLIFPREVSGEQFLCRWKRGEGEWTEQETICGVRFVPLL